MLIDYLVALGNWNWLILAAIFFVHRTARARRVHAVARALGAAGRRSSRSSSIWPWQSQLIAFAVFALASIPLWRRFARRVEKPVDQPFLNRRADAFVGREFTLEKPIVAGIGTVRIDDTVWRVAGAGLRRPAAASRSCAPTRRRWWWSR